MFFTVPCFNCTDGHNGLGLLGRVAAANYPEPVMPEQKTRQTTQWHGIQTQCGVGAGIG
jgi:hypothetical protein